MSGKKFCWAALGLALCASAQAAPQKLALALRDKSFSVYSMEFSADGEQVCIAGVDHDDLGSSTGRLISIDRGRNVIRWQKTFPVPDGYAGLFPVQCLPTNDRVYLLANVDTKSSPPITQTLTYVYSFDAQGIQLARRRLVSPARSQYGYAMDVTADGIKVAGYLKNEDQDFEYYSVYTTVLNLALQVQGEPVIRKTGAYLSGSGSRVVGDSLYAAGVFAPAKIAKDQVIDDFAASRIRLAGGYAWSVHPQLGARPAVSAGVAADGTIHVLRNEGRSTTLLTVPPDGKPLPPRTYSSRYCDTRAIAGYGKGLIALRETCDDNARRATTALLEIDPASGKETELKWVDDQVVGVATSGRLWSAIAKNPAGKLFFYSSEKGFLYAQ
ncbi:hypothetical protein [Rugamonas rivuli]|uniref:Uncharacterized protein n=1 Tax=Rugamonas rivuli TaxID=2743358 RepID=A0A843SHI1_9BURK|nr:hypothetical protein [Rugamonas rivuli]MQA19866.1 hypothetical protein [Rugamonas rivuli]